MSRYWQNFFLTKICLYVHVTCYECEVCTTTYLSQNDYFYPNLIIFLQSKLVIIGAMNASSFQSYRVQISNYLKTFELTALMV